MSTHTTDAVYEPADTRQGEERGALIALLREVRHSDVKALLMDALVDEAGPLDDLIATLIRYPLLPGERLGCSPSLAERLVHDLLQRIQGIMGDLATQRLVGVGR